MWSCGWENTNVVYDVLATVQKVREAKSSSQSCTGDLFGFLGNV